MNLFIFSDDRETAVLLANVVAVTRIDSIVNIYLKGVFADQPIHAVYSCSNYAQRDLDKLKTALELMDEPT